MIITVTKSYRDYPAAHRQPKHSGHCRLIHGHDWGFDIVFGCDKLDANSFVVDVGKLQAVKTFLGEHFDHTLLLNLDDPLVADKAAMNIVHELAKVVLVPNCGMESLAKFVFEGVMQLIDAELFDVAFDRNLHVVEVTCWEDSKNRSTYYPTPQPKQLEE